ncbi:hypothetical protein BKA66DRAFT_537881 [Pyrenochaeta sp. MPI-SDFR-AT-0127]|nr:hypothetical protein BKA66DRAFT_537881 [Pyrenochaeta sp. MPI-SDFR-AT-0127]
MKYSGLYYVPNVSTSLDTSLSTVSTLVQGVETSFQNTTRQNLWSLSYRAFRDTLPHGYQPSTDSEGKPKQFAHTYQHLLHLTALSSNRTYVCTQPPGQQGTVASISVRQQDMYSALVRHQSAALWSARHILSVQQGTTYSGGLCTIQIGELRATREGPQSGAVQSPGVVVCITTIVGGDISDETPPESKGENGTAMEIDEEPKVDFDYAQAVIRDCWARIKDGRDLGRSEIKEVMMAPEDVKGVQEKDAAVRMWCEVLRLRG